MKFSRVLLLLFSSICVPSQAQTSVDYATGTAAISVPLYNMNGPTMQFPVDLSYNASGIGVNDVASWSGIGWNVSGGGAIVRVKNGLPDERLLYGLDQVIKKAGYLWCKDFYRDETGEFDFPEQYDSTFTKMDLDLSPDEFYVNAPGLQGKFIFALDAERPESEFLQFDAAQYPQSSPVMFMPFQNLKVSYNRNTSPTGDGTFSQFVITNELGYKYYFSYKQWTTINTVQYADDQLIQAPAPETYCSAWYLTKIENCHRQREVEYTYSTNTNNSVVMDYNEVHFSGTGSVSVFKEHPLASNNTNSTEPCTPPYEWLRTRAYNTSKIVHLSKIKVLNQELEFISSVDQRLDLAGDFPLSEIVLKINGSVISKKKLTYDYFTSTMPAPIYISAQDKKRLKLLKVETLNEMSWPIDAGTSFEYYESDIPYRNCFSQDHWGFYNHASNTSLVSQYNFGNYYAYQTGANREAGGGICSIKRITNPKGGYQELEFENHVYRRDVVGEVIPTLVLSEATIILSAEVPCGPSCTNYPGSISEILDEEDFVIPWVAGAPDQTIHVHYTIDPEGNSSNNSNCQSAYQQIKIQIINSNDLAVGQWTNQAETTVTSYDVYLTLPPGTYTFRVISNLGYSGNLPCGNVEASLHYYSTSGGGYYNYEHHTGGARIKKITTSDGTGLSDNTNVLTFDYETTEGESSGTLLSRPEYHSSNHNSNEVLNFFQHHDLFDNLEWDGSVTKTYNCDIHSRSSSSTNALAVVNGSPVMYSRIRVSDGSGYTIYEYDIAELTPTNSISGGPSTVKTWRNSNVQKITVFDNEDNILSISEYEYDYLPMAYNSDVNLYITRLTSTDGDIKVLYTGLDPAVVEAQMQSAMINAALSMGSLMLGPQVTPLAVVSLIVSVANVVRLALLSDGETPVILTFDQGVNYYFERSPFTYSTEWVQVKEIARTMYSHNNVDNTSTIQHYEYMDENLAPINGMFPITQQARKITTFNQENPTYKEATFTNYVANYSCSACTYNSDDDAFGIKTMQELAMYGVPIESLFLIEENSIEHVVSGQLHKYVTTSSANIANDPGYSGTLMNAGYLLDLETPVPFNTFTQSSISGSGVFSMHSAYQMTHEIEGFDRNLKVLGFHKSDDVSKGVLRSNQDGKVLMEVINTGMKDFKYIGFEDTEDLTEWSFLGCTRVNTTYVYNGFTSYRAKTGSYFLKMDGTLQTSVESGIYKLTFWSNSGSIDVSGSNQVTLVTPVHIGIETDPFGWKYYEFIVNSASGGNISITSFDQDYLDEVRLFPFEAQVATTQYNEFGQVISVCSATNECSYFSFDPWHRHRWKLDDERNIVSFTNIVARENDASGLASTTRRIMKEAGIHYDDAYDLTFMNPTKVSVNTVYFDGFGRPIQSILKHGSGSGNHDLIAFKLYNRYGLQEKYFLPYSISNTDDGFRSDYINEQLSFYQDASFVAHTNSPFTTNVYRASPLHELVEQGLPGDDTQPLPDLVGNTKFFKTYLNAADEVRKWTVDRATSEIVSHLNDFWPANSLIKSETEDENGKVSWRYFDIYGKLVLHRIPIYVTGQIGDKHYVDEFASVIRKSTDLTDENLYFLDSYYIYNEKGLKSFEITPAMIEK